MVYLLNSTEILLMIFFHYYLILTATHLCVSRHSKELVACLLKWLESNSNTLMLILGLNQRVSGLECSNKPLI